MLEALNLTQSEAGWLALICFGAGLVRGFSGFALSAVVMAVAVLILPPLELIPILWWLEMTASVMMVRGGWRDAERTVVLGLVIGSALGAPLGVWLTTTLPVETSKLVALAIIIALAMTQLARIRIAFLATRPGLYAAGLTAGVVTGLAHVGGMVVALYVLSQQAPARRMRAALVLFLFLASLTSMITFLAFGVMNAQATLRGFAFALPTAAGVFFGQALFTQKWEPLLQAFLPGPSDPACHFRSRQAQPLRNMRCWT